MATRLSLYNGALLECGERDLASLSENREPRRLLDRAWDNGAVDFCLGKGQWKFATRTVMLAPSTSYEPQFGYRNAYDIPEDHVRTVGMYVDEYLKTPLLEYNMEGRKWFTDSTPIYVSYISNGANWGGGMANWPAEFARAVEAYLASRIVVKLTQSEDKEKLLMAKAEKFFKDSANSDAMEGPTKFLPAGSWARARRGNGRGDSRGNGGSITG